MRILFPSHPLHRRQADPEYAGEWRAARAAGFACELYDVDRLREGNAPEALKCCAPATSAGEAILHRGWMLRCWAYGSLHRELIGLGYRPVVSPQEYAEAHYLPNAYPLLAGHTPESRWLAGNDVRAAWSVYEELAAADVIVKDFVKSAKHRWQDACFIPAQTPYARFKDILLTFLYVRGDAFEKGFVFRRAHSLVTTGAHSCGRPKHEEVRLFFWDGELLAATDEGPLVELARWTKLARRFSNRFITLDVARQMDGSWIVIETGDGGVSALPEGMRAEVLYKGFCTF
ncbi:MAG TPA: ATP-grasp domain-containing protein [Verrucomicrobiae bacterium]